MVVEIVEEETVVVDVVAAQAVAMVVGQAGWAVALLPGRAVLVFAPVVDTGNNTW